MGLHNSHWTFPALQPALYKPSKADVPFSEEHPQSQSVLPGAGMLGHWGEHMILGAILYSLVHVV